MLPTRFVPGQAPRKSRLGERQSFLPRRVGSTDRLSDSRRPSGIRSSSAEAGRSTMARVSRDASALKPPMNRRSRSQQADSRPGQAYMTPLRNSQFRPTTTPVRTPSGDRPRTVEAAIERALACVTVKDQRPISNTAWQRATLTRVQEALSSRQDLGPIIRPLTITRFVDIVGALLRALTGDDKLNNDNYVAKLPHMCKRVLYPGTVSKSWLKTVNTLHAFPQALALIAYLLDLLNLAEMPVTDDLYEDSSELARLRRDYLRACFERFQVDMDKYNDLDEAYLHQLRELLGADDDKIKQMEDVIKQHEQALSEELESSEATRATEASRAARRDALLSTLRATRLNIVNTRAALDAARARARDAAAALATVDDEIARATAETAQLKRELQTQVMSVEERAKLLDEVDYATRVHDSKRVLADQIAKMVHSKETELALWQKKTLDSCVEYKQGLIHLSAQFPELAGLAMDETHLMEPECLALATSALEVLRQLSSKLSQRRAQLARTRTAKARERHEKMEEARKAIAEYKAQIEQAISSRDNDLAADAAEEAAAAALEAEASKRLEAYKDAQEEFRKVHEELAYWKKQDEAWRTKLAAMHEYIRSLKENEPAFLEAAFKARVQIVADELAQWKLNTQNVL